MLAIVMMLNICCNMNINCYLWLTVREESEVGDLAQPSLTQIQVNCKSCHPLDVMVLFKNKGQTQQLFLHRTIP